MHQILDKFWSRSFCYGLIEWADSQSFGNNSAKPYWERSTENMIVFEDQKLADKIFEKIKEKLPPENSYGRLMGADDYLRLFRFEQGLHCFTPKDFSRSHKEQIFYRLVIMLNGQSELTDLNVRAEAGNAILTTNPFPIQLDNRANFYLLIADITYRK
jgi:hypothetical protein